MPNNNDTTKSSTNYKGQTLYDWCFNNDKMSLLDEWDYEKNIDVTPKTITSGSDRKVWWIVRYDDPKTGKHFDFSWEATVSHRKEGRTCPYLSQPAKKVLIGFNDLLTTHPNLGKEWDYVENDKRGIKITDVTYGSTKVVYWKCQIHGTYDARISSRAQGNGCPYCAGKRIAIGINDLKTVEPDIAKEWDYEKNKVSPETVTIGCITKYWWKCNKGHSWQATPNSRTSGGRTGCPYCASKKILVGFNDLQSQYPELAKEWNYAKNKITPQEIMPMSNKKVWWICKSGHEYQSNVCTKVGFGSSCPICYKERKTSFPEKAIYYYVQKYIPDAEENKKFSWLGQMELDIYIPSLDVAIEYDGGHWHQYVDNDSKKDNLCIENGVDLIRVREDDCPDYDSLSTKIVYGKSCAIKDIDSVIETILDYIKNRFFLDIDYDVDTNRDYPIILENLINGEKKNNLATIRPNLAKEWDYIKNGNTKPEYVKVYSNKKVWWICPKCKNSYRMMINDRTGNKKSNCPYCAGKRILIGYNDLQTTNPDLIKEWDFDINTIKPTNIHSGSHKDVWWKCPKGHSWQSKVYVRAKMGCGCPYCAGQNVDNHNSFADLYPHLLTEWMYDKNDRDPYTILPNSNIKFWWKCNKCGYEWRQNLAKRIIGRSCPLCVHQVLVPGINDLQTQFPEVAKEWDSEKNNLKAYEISGGTNKSYWWKCSHCGNSWKCIVASRTKRGSRCPECHNSVVENID